MLTGHDWDMDLDVCKACGLYAIDVAEFGYVPPCHPSAAVAAHVVAMRRRMEEKLAPILKSLDFCGLAGKD